MMRGNSNKKLRQPLSGWRFCFVLWLSLQFGHLQDLCLICTNGAYTEYCTSLCDFHFHSHLVIADLLQVIANCRIEHQCMERFLPIDPAGQ